MHRLLSAGWLWPALAVFAACIPFAGGFSLTTVFYICDITMFLWPRHLWMHRTLLADSWPLWDVTLLPLATLASDDVPPGAVRRQG